MCTLGYIYMYVGVHLLYVHTCIRRCMYMYIDLCTRCIESYVSNSHIGFDPDYECH